MNESALTSSTTVRTNADLSERTRLQAGRGQRPRWLLVTTIGALAFSVACGGTKATSRLTTDHPSLAPLAFDLPLIDGGRLTAETLRGRYVVLKPFAAWCGDCWNELPLLVEASARLRNASVSFVAVALDTEDGAPRNLVEELRVPFYVAHDPTAQLPPRLSLHALSPLYVFGPVGELLVRYPKCGRREIEDLVERLSQIAK